jgi:hypothetical protein
MAGDGANLKTKLDDDVNGARTRCADMMKAVKICATRVIVSMRR